MTTGRGCGGPCSRGRKGKSGLGGFCGRRWVKSKAEWKGSSEGGWCFCLCIVP